MQNNINTIITNALIVKKDNLNKKNIKSMIKQIKISLEKNKEAILEVNKIDKKNENGFIIDYDIINNIFSNIEKEDAIYGKVTLSQKDDNKKIIYGKQLMDYGIVLVINDGNPYITIEMILRNILSGNTTIVSNSGYMYGTNQIIIQIIQTVLQQFNISKNFIQIFLSEDYDDVLSNYANIDLVVCIGNHNLQRKIIEKSKIKTIISGYENFDLYIEDATNLEFINKIMNTGLNIQCFINSNVNLAKEDAIIVNDIDEAIAQINYNGNKYSSSIFTSKAENASKFIKEVKSSIVTINTSPTIERIIDIKQLDLMKEKTIIYPLSFKFNYIQKVSNEKDSLL